MKPTYIVLHTEAGPVGKTGDRFAAINEYHRNLYNFRSALGLYSGYHYVIEKSGKVIQARRDDEPGAHTYQQGMNYKSIGICLAGDHSKERPEPPQIFALRDLIRRLQTTWRIRDRNIRPHHDFAIYKVCPGQFIDLEFIRTKLTVEKKTLWDWLTLH